jgi:hypothetical protein
MKKGILLIAALWLGRSFLNAQDSKELAYKPIKTISLSNGRYIEEFTNDTLVRLGSVVFNTVRNDVEYFIQDNDAKYKKAVHQPEDASRFLSVDRLTSSFPELTPYQYASNTPIMATDLDGLEANAAIWSTGQDAGAFLMRAQDLKNRTTALQFEVHSMPSGKDFVQLLKSETKKEGSIRTIVTFSHAFQGGVSFDIGNRANFQTIQAPEAFRGPNYASFNELQKSVDAGEVKFEKDALVILGGCNTATSEGAPYGVPIAESFTKTFGVSSIGSDGSFSPIIENGKETGKYHSENGWIRYDKDASGNILKTALGKDLDVADYINKNMKATTGSQPGSSTGGTGTQQGTTVPQQGDTTNGGGGN